MTFSDKLRLALSRTDLTQENFAREVGVTLRTAQFWLAGTREPKGRQLVAIADVLGESAGWFFDAEEPTEKAAA